tara:strand:- start:880 stop:2202 length:1323 start_codon:yes stop_codon:yes gene_type:complete
MSKSISIDEPDIVSFYENNPHLNIVEVNRAFIEIMKSLSTDMAKTFQNTKLGEITSNIESVKAEIDKRFDESRKRFDESRKEIQEEVRRTISSSFVSQSKEFTSQTKEINAILDRNSTSIAEKVASRQKEESLNALSIQVQQPLMAVFEKMSEDLLLQRKDGEKLSTELWDFLNKYKHSSSTKGAVSENMLYDLLNSILPTDEIIDCTGQTASGDFMVNRRDTTLPRFIVENKDYTRKANTAEVAKFERDIQEQKCHGIFLSQSSDITFKDPYQVDLIDGFIHVYVPNVNFDPTKVKIAIDMIDQLSKGIEMVERSNATENNTDIRISKTELELIAEEYKTFAENKAHAIESAKTTIKLIESTFSLPSLQSLLNVLGKVTMPESLTCKFCNNYTGKNKNALAAHTRRCKFNPKSPSYETPNTNEPAQCPPAPIENVNLSI